jgi:hypothetical protein
MTTARRLQVDADFWDDIRRAECESLDYEVPAVSWPVRDSGMMDAALQALQAVQVRPGAIVPVPNAPQMGQWVNVPPSGLQWAPNPADSLMIGTAEERMKFHQQQLNQAVASAQERAQYQNALAVAQAAGVSVGNLKQAVGAILGKLK